MLSALLPIIFATQKRWLQFIVRISKTKTGVRLHSCFYFGDPYENEIELSISSSDTHSSFAPALKTILIWSS
jgi:hypothetical protein